MSSFNFVCCEMSERLYTLCDKRDVRDFSLLDCGLQLFAKSSPEFYGDSRPENHSNINSSQEDCMVETEAENEREGL